jgi:hypothetical protein
MSIDTAAEPLAGEIVQYAPPAGIVDEYRPRILMAADEAKALSDQLRECMLAVLREGVDYGTIPGAGEKKNLLKPGAEKLLQWFGFGSRSIEVKTERDDPEHSSGIADKVRRVGVTYRTEITKTIPGGGEVTVATCEGYAGYDEDRYYASAEEARAKAEQKERFWAAKDGRQPNPKKWEIAAEYRAPWNTLIKMSQKRSYVGAAIDATGAAGLFTQDMEDAADTNAAPAGLATAGRAAIERMPVAVKQELNAWYGSVNWPGPDAWDTEQWCTALVKAGWISRAVAAPQQQAQRPAPAAKPAAAKQEEPKKPQPAADAPLTPGLDGIAQVFAERASKAMTAKDLTVVVNEAAETNKMDARIREPGGTVVGTLRAYFTYCENTLQQPAGSPA